MLGPAAEPFATPLGDVAVALMAGNGVVLKPSPHAALAGERIARIFARAGLPEGLLRVVHGHADVGGALVEAPAVDQVRFTGSARAGRAVGEACARGLKRSVLELGGKDPMLVLGRRERRALGARRRLGRVRQRGPVRRQHRARATRCPRSPTASSPRSSAAPPPCAWATRAAPTSTSARC